MGKAFYVITLFCTLYVCVLPRQMQLYFPIWQDFTFETASAKYKYFETNFHEKSKCCTVVKQKNRGSTTAFRNPCKLGSCGKLKIC